MKNHRFPKVSWTAALCSAGLLLSPAITRPAQACGGFWCSQDAPVNQAAEQIIFVDNPDGTVTAVIQIQYVGPSEKFAWVIPIPGSPDIGVSSNVAFQRLEQATAPQYVLKQVVQGTCRQDGYGEAATGGRAGPMSDSADAGASPPVVVVDQGSVGPYDYAVISVNPALQNPADVAIQWFMDEGYDLTENTADLLGPYLADGLNLLAFRLTKGNSDGAIRPVVLTYRSELPMIPIRPTAVAAENDMGVKVWVVAEKQAVPENYKSLVLNEALINWFNYQQNYNQVVTAAANEAGGQGFVTELAGKSAEYAQLLFSEADESNWQRLSSQSFADGIDAIFAANNYYRDWDGWRETIEGSVTLPSGVSYDDFGRNPDAYRGTAQVDIDKFFMLLDQDLVSPARQARDLVASRPYLTRLYSTMSSEEMTVDPAFTFNADLADIDNVHTATQYIMCHPYISYYEAPWRIVLPQGGVITGRGNDQWPVQAGDQPANLKVVQLSENGSGEVVTDNSEKIGDELLALTGIGPTTSSMRPSDGMTIGGNQQVTTSGGGGGLCSTSTPGSRTQGAWLTLALLGLALFGVRQR